MTGEYDLNIERVLENWMVAHALREVIADALAIAEAACEIVQMASMRATTDTFLAHLLRPTTHYRPDVEALRAAPARIVVAAGATSTGQLANRDAVTP